MSYANETAVREALFSALGSARLKMADGKSSLGMAFPGASNMDEPSAKRSKMSQLTNCGFLVADAEPSPCFPGDTGNCGATVNCTQPTEKEAEPVMAVEQAPVALGGDNNGLGALVPESFKPVEKSDDGAALGTTTGGAGKKKKNWRSLNWARVVRQVSGSRLFSAT